MYFLYICFYLCTGVFYFSRPVPFFGRVSARSGIVSLFTCVTTVFLSKHKTNLVPSFLPALSSSTCIISLANQYNTSVDTAIESGGWFPGGMCERNSAQWCCDHILGSAVLMVGWETNDSLFLNIISTLILMDSAPSHYYLKKTTKQWESSSCQETYETWSILGRINLSTISFLLQLPQKMYDISFILYCNDCEDSH